MIELMLCFVIAFTFGLTGCNTTVDKGTPDESTVSERQLRQIDTRVRLEVEKEDVGAASVRPEAGG